MSAALHHRIEHDLTNHPPAHQGVVDRFDSVRRRGKALAHELVDQCPESRELSLALTAVEQAVMYGVAAIARHQEQLEASAQAAGNGVAAEAPGHSDPCSAPGVASEEADWPRLRAARRQEDHRVMAADWPRSEIVAREFHQAYEDLAPHFGYATREASAVPWAEVPEPNRRLMVAVVEHLMSTGVIQWPGRS